MRGPWRFVLSLASVAIASVLAGPAAADQGIGRDLGFGVGGRVVVADVLATIGSFDVMAQTNGRILVAVAHGSDATFVRRYRADGSIDTTFATGGDIQLPPMLSATWLPRNPQQPIFVVLATATENVFQLRRYDAAGAMDTTFGTGGEATFGFPIGYNGLSIVADASGRVAVSSSNHTSASDTTRVHVFGPTGQADATFGVGGMAVLDGVVADVAAIDSLGRLVITAVPSQSFQPVIGRLTLQGQPDSTFGGDGYASLVGNLANPTVTATADDGVAVAAREVHLGGLTINVQRLTSAGDPALGFGNGGVVRVPFLDLQPRIGNTSESAAPDAIVDHDDGRLAVIGNSFAAAVAFVLEADGSFDETFGQGGRAVVSSRMTMLAGSIEPSGTVHFLGFDEFRPVFLQRSVPGSPWPPVAPAPQNLVARVTSPGRVEATWSPVVNPDPEVTESGYFYEITPYPFSFSGRTFTTDTFGGLAPLPPGIYTFTVWSSNSFADGLRSSTTFTIPANPSAADFVAFTPVRLLDTRPDSSTIDGQYLGAGAVGAGSTTELRITGRGGIAESAAAVALNVTVTQPATAGFVSVYPCGGSRPNASNVNFTAGQTVANVVIAKPSAGSVCLFSSAPAHLVVDATGYHEATSELVALTPARLMDTRPGYGTIDGDQSGAGRRAAGVTTELAVANRGGVGAAPTAVVLNVTVTDPSASGFVTVYPCGAAVPTASNANFVAGQTIANAVIAKTGTNARVCIFTSASTHLAVDVAGHFPSSSEFSPLTPARLLESRAGLSTVDGRFSGVGVQVGGGVTALDVLGRGGVDPRATAIALTVTATEPADPGFVTVFPCSSARPTTSNLNFAARQTIANAVIVQVGTDGRVCLFSSVATHLVVDVNGFYP